MHFYKIHRLVFGLLCFFLLPLAAYAQKGRVVAAVEQCWSGGMRGRHGCNYSFTIEIKAGNNKNKPRPDTLWIGDYPVALVEKNSTPEGDGNMKVSRSKYGMKFEIHAATTFDDEEERYPNPQQERTAKLVPVSPKKYKGVALLSYKYMGKRYFYEIVKFTEQKPHISYP